MSANHPLKWIEHFRIHQTAPDGRGWVQANPSLRALAIQSVKEALQNLSEFDRLDLDKSRAGGVHPDGEYCWAQICLRGHILRANGLPKQGERCPKSNMETGDICQGCQAPIRGQSVTSTAYQLPNYCHACGKPYPWMKDKLDTARELLDHDDKLTLDERNELWGLLQYVMSDPKSDLAPAKSKLIDIKVRDAVQVTRELVLDLIARCFAETVKS
jgi:hypothetical protein